MTRRPLLLRTVILVHVGTFVWAGLSIWGVTWMLAHSVQARQELARSYLVYGLAAALLLSGMLMWQLQPVLRLLDTWDRGREPDPMLPSRAQARALSLPGQFLGQVALLVLIGSSVLFALRMQRPGYPLIDALLEIVFHAALALGVASAISVGLRLLLQAGVLRRLVLPVPATGGSSLTARLTWMTVLLGLVAVGLGGTLALAAVIHAVEQTTAEGQARWLAFVAPEALRMPAEQQLGYVAGFAGPGESPFILDATGQVWSLAPLPSVVEAAGKLRHVSQPFLWREDASALRVLAVPFGSDQVLGLAYDSRAVRSPIVINTVRVLAVLALGELLLAVFLGAVTGRGLASTMRLAIARLRSLAADMPTSPLPIAQTWPDELGELADAVNRVQEQVKTLIAQQQVDRAALQAVNRDYHALQETTQSLTAPVIRVADGLVVVPLTGYFDDERAARIRPHLLAGIAAQRARVAVIDVTGVTEATDALIECLGQAVHSAALMGCQVVLTGAGPSLAWSLTQQETDLVSCAAHRDLEEGLAYARAHLGAN